VSATSLPMPPKASSESPCSVKQSTVITALPCTLRDAPPTYLSTRLPRQQVVRSSISQMPPTPNDDPVAPRHVVQTPRTSAAVTSLRQQLRSLRFPAKLPTGTPNERPSTPDAPNLAFCRHEPLHIHDNPLASARGNLSALRGSMEPMPAQPAANHSRRLSLQAAPPMSASIRRSATGPGNRRDGVSLSTFYPPGSTAACSRRMSLPASHFLPPDRSCSRGATPKKDFAGRAYHFDSPCPTARAGTANASLQSTPRKDSLMEVSARLRFVQSRPHTARTAGPALVLPPFRVGKVPTNARGEPALGDGACTARCRPASHGFLTERPKTTAGRMNPAATQSGRPSSKSSITYVFLCLLNTCLTNGTFFELWALL
jgi:hypothetical protein